jgi:SAM-dependent methyltransferase
MDQNIRKLWLDLLDCQTALTLPLELPHYYACSKWKEAPAVLDLGTGPGYYFCRLARLFPEKSYVGIDIDESYVEMAQDGAPPYMRFMQSDLFDFKEQFPVVMAHLVAQHLPSLDTFLNKVTDLLTPEGCFISVEPKDELRLYYPSLPNISEMFRNFSQAQRKKGLNRDAGAVMERLSASCGLRLEQTVDIIIPSSLPTYKTLFVHFHQLIFDLFSGPFEMHLNRDVLDDELNRWTKDTRSYTHLGVHFAVYRKA